MREIIQQKPHSDRLRIAVVGAGISGISAAWYLSKKHSVTLFEKEIRLGGHTHTVTIPSGPDKGTPVDTGFIVLNDETYTNFKRFLRELGVGTRVSTMSFSYLNQQSGFHYGGNTFNGLFSQRKNLINPSYYAFLAEVVRFNQLATKALESQSFANETIEDFVLKNKLSRRFLADYLIPLTAAVWSTPPEKSLEFPAETLVRFFANHGILRLLNRPTWRTVVGGSSAYVKAFEEQFNGFIRLGEAPTGISRGELPTLHFPNGEQEAFDRVVIATHADQALQLLQDPTELEQQLLLKWQYTRNETVLHTDATVMPPHRRAWCSWNFHQENESNHPHLSMTYHMNTLQGLKTKHDYFVTLNRAKPYKEKTVVKRLMYTHPKYDFDSYATQRDLPQLNGPQGTYFCGSYHGYGFHEDGITAALNVARAFGIHP
ncbi:MAG: NAD(P)/FAD-dependent oxidoreductase [Sumerlaeia bacterium]